MTLELLYSHNWICRTPEQTIGQENYTGLAEYVEIIRTSSWRSLDLLTNLLEWARSQTGIMKFTPQKIEISRLINDAKDLLSDSAFHKSIEVKVLLPENFTIYADISMIKPLCETC
jgi:two-component system, sensor histidine kinase and response regulator